MTITESESLEFSYFVEHTRFCPSGRSFTLETDPEIRKRIARRLGIPSVESLVGEAVIKSTAIGFTIEGRLCATLIRECVSTLEPLSESIDERFVLEFTRKLADCEDGEDLSLLEEPEYVENDEIDLGEILVQQLALMMDAYPRKVDTTTLIERYGRVEERSPFAVLLGEVAEVDGEG